MACHTPQRGSYKFGLKSGKKWLKSVFDLVYRQPIKRHYNASVHHQKPVYHRTYKAFTKKRLRYIIHRRRMCWSRKVNHYPDIASLKFTLIRRWLSPKISRNLHKPKFWWIQRLFWCKKIWIDLSGKTPCTARTRFIATRHPSATYWPQGSCEEAGIRSRNTER